jgi:hypothetical protein
MSFSINEQDSRLFGDDETYKNMHGQFSGFCRSKVAGHEFKSTDFEA